MAKTHYEKDMEDSLQQIAKAFGVKWEHFPDVEELIRAAYRESKNAKRYCWLRDHGAVCGMRGIFSLMPGEWDEAIDAAIARRLLVMHNSVVSGCEAVRST